jgi:hypothetical protein
MSLYNNRSDESFQAALGSIRPGVIFVVIILGALIAFEIFNYSTTDLALKDLLGDLTFAGLHWSTILAVAFCGIDFAGIARLFTAEQDSDEPKEVWYLFGAWLLAATMNAILTWWGVSMAVINHNIQSASMVDAKTITGVVPVFVAVMVWVIRILIIGTLSISVDRLLHPQQAAAARARASAPRNRPAMQQPFNAPAGLNSAGTGMPARPAVSRAAVHGSRSASSNYESNAGGVQEPTYHSVGSYGARQRPGSQNRQN